MEYRRILATTVGGETNLRTLTLTVRIQKSHSKFYNAIISAQVFNH